MSLFHVYTDGACSGNPGPGGWAAVILDANRNLVQELSGFIPDTTNNRMEIQAAISGIKLAIELSPLPEVLLYSDSSYLVNTYTKGWMQAWLRTGWKKGSVKNRDLWLELNLLLTGAKVRWVKVRGHSDNEYNNRCDQLAVQAIKQQGKTAEQTQTAPLLVNAPGIDAERVKFPAIDPATLNKPLSTKPSENRCLVSVTELPENAAKIRQVAERYPYSQMKGVLHSSTLSSVTSSVAAATYNHPEIKVHPLFLQVGQMTDFWLARNAARPSPYPAPSRPDLVKFICAFIVESAVNSAKQLGLEQPEYGNKN